MGAWSDWFSSNGLHRGGGTPVVVKMENPNNWSISEISSPEEEDPRRRKEKKNAKQVTWVLLLRAHRAAGCLASLASASVKLASTARRRVSAGRTDNSGGRTDSSPHRFYTCLKAFLWLSLVLLCFEVVAYYKEYHLRIPDYSMVISSLSLNDLFHSVYTNWVSFRAGYIAPPLQFLSDACVVLFLIQSADRLILCLGAFWIKLKGIKPVPKSGFGSKKYESDPEAGEHFPMVLVQIPMCNEKEVYQQSIAAVCNLDWPKSNFLVQILDDSDDVTTQKLIKAEVEKWQQNGAQIVYRHREIRDGFKAGNLKSAMACNYVKDYEFVAIFDADFQPASDFLKRTVPHFKGNDELGLVQTRWSFVNKDENLLTRLQNINLCFHFEVEQQVNGVFLNFFGFNGTAGVWRIKALEDSGGWMERTTVEDMDVAVRAHLMGWKFIYLNDVEVEQQVNGVFINFFGVWRIKALEDSGVWMEHTTVEDMDVAVRAHLIGWKFIYLNDVECQCELPESYEAYRKQQHRWHSGPMQLFRLCLPDIIRSKISIWKKANLVFLFFLLRKLILPFYSFTLFCIILPMTMFVPEAGLPEWVVCYVPATMSVLNILPAPRSFPFMIPYLLFENTMSVTKFHAMVSGLFQLPSSFEWVVTKKSGRASDGDLAALSEMVEDKKVKKERKKKKKKKHNRMYRKELMLAFLLLTAAVRSLLSAQGIHFYFLLFQGVSFLLVGLDLIGEQID